jgi:prepilin-type N-terminal cleavage/methylation domain-containing protein
MTSSRGFTLIELLIVIGIIAVLATVVIVALNPVELFRQARDSTRLSDLGTLNTALATYSADQGGSMGTASTTYVSLPDTSPTRANLGLPTLPAGWNYACVTQVNLKNTDGTGWIPVNFASVSFGKPISVLPIDPVNTTTTGNYYTYVTGGSWILTAIPESQRQKTALATSPNILNYPGVMAAGTNLSLSPLYNSSGLVGYWKFDEGSGTNAAESSGGGNGATLFDSPTWTTGKVGSGALTFDASSWQSTYTANTSTTQPTTAVSLAFWMKAGTTNGIQHVIAADTNADSLTHGYGAWLQNNYFEFYAVTYSGGGLMISYSDTTNWHHVVGTFDGSNVRLYLDGVLNGSTPIAGPIDYTGATYGFTLGAAQHSAHTIYYYTGSLDDVRVYNRALSAAEVAALYNATK